MRNIANKKQVLSWALYDWANSAFATTVMAGFFPIFYKQYWAAGTETSTSTFQLGMANAVASLVIVLSAPIIGAIADAGKFKKAFLFSFACIGIICTGLLYAVGKSEWSAAAMLFSGATVGFMGANVFYDALILNVSNEENRDVVSALGFALGYLGGGLLFAVNVAMTLSPESFGLADASEAVKLSFVSVSVWWAVFSVPLFLFVHEKKEHNGNTLLVTIKRGLRQFVATFHEIRSLRMVWLFLLAYWLYIDGVDTVVRMAVDYGLSIGLQSEHLIVALLVTQFVGFPAAIAFGYLGKHVGTKQGIYLALVIYVLVTAVAYFIDQVWEFYLLAGMIGLVQGGIQSLSRSYYADIIPPDKPAEFFGFYNMMGKSAALIGPLLVGVIVLYSGDHRLGMLSLIILFVAGGALLTKVKR